MNWLNLHTATLRRPEFIGSEPVARATWLYVTAYCCEQENGGRIVGARAWKDRQWQQTCGVTRTEIEEAAPLLVWEGDDLLVFAYPVAKEEEVRAKRENGRLGGRASGKARRAPSGEPQAEPQAEPTSEAPGKPHGPADGEPHGEAVLRGVLERKGKGMEGEGKDNGISEERDNASAPAEPVVAIEPKQPGFPSLEAVKSHAATCFPPAPESFAFSWWSEMEGACWVDRHSRPVGAKWKFTFNAAWTNAQHTQRERAARIKNNTTYANGNHANSDAGARRAGERDREFPEPVAPLPRIQ